MAEMPTSCPIEIVILERADQYLSFVSFSEPAVSPGTSSPVRFPNPKPRIFARKSSVSSLSVIWAVTSLHETSRAPRAVR